MDVVAISYRTFVRKSSHGVTQLKHNEHHRLMMCMGIVDLYCF